MKITELLYRLALIAITIVLIAACDNPASSGNNGGSGSGSEDGNEDGSDSGGSGTIALGSATLDITDPTTGDQLFSLSGETLWANTDNIDTNNDRWNITTTDPNGASLEITVVRGRNPGDPFATVPDDFDFNLASSGFSELTPGDQVMNVTLETADGTQYTSIANGVTGTANFSKDSSLNEWSITMDGEGLEEIGASGTPETVDLAGSLTAIPEDGLIVADIDEIALENVLLTDVNLAGDALDLQFSNPGHQVEISMGNESSAPFQYETGTYQLSDPILNTLFLRANPGESETILTGSTLLQISAANETQGRISGAVLLTGLDGDDVVGATTPDNSFTLNLTFSGVRVE
ncbi:MAG TPA: hypothetical protein VJ932_07295 [Alkalispirochaeta sp.]|nr:hypothetical protein [Alkalispirochaeta sp.]